MIFLSAVQFILLTNIGSGFPPIKNGFYNAAKGTTLTWEFGQCAFALFNDKTVNINVCATDLVRVFIRLVEY